MQLYLDGNFALAPTSREESHKTLIGAASLLNQNNKHAIFNDNSDQPGNP